MKCKRTGRLSKRGEGAEVFPPPGRAARERAQETPIKGAAVQRQEPKNGVKVLGPEGKD